MGVTATTDVLRRLRGVRLASWFHVPRLLAHHGLVLVAAVAAGAAVAGLYVVLQPVQYRAGAVISLETDRVVAAGVHPELAGMTWANASLLQDTQFIAGVLGGSPQSRRDAEDAARRIEVEQDAGARTVTLYYTGDSKDSARRAVQALLGAYRGNLLEQIRSRKTEVQALLQQKAGEVKVRADEAEAAWREAVQQVSGGESGTPLLPGLEAAARQAAEEEARWQKDYGRISALEGDAKALLAVPEIFNHSSILLVRKRIAEQEALLQQLNLQYGPDHPASMQVTVKLEEQRRVLNDAALQFPELLKNRLAKAQAAMLKARKDLEEHQALLQRLKAGGKDPETLQAVLRDARSVYAAAWQRLQELESEDVGSGGLQPSELPVEELRVPARQIIGTAALGSLAAGLLLAWLAFLVNPAVMTRRELETALQKRAYAVIPRDPHGGGLHWSRLQHRPANAPATEAFRECRAALSEESGGATRLVLVAGPRGGEGASYLALNLAAACAGAGFETLLVDAQLRAPAQSRAIFSAPTLPGLSDYALGIDGLENLVREVSDRLHLLPSGRAVPNPSELLGYDWFAGFVQEVRERYRFVILDTAPLLAYSDTLPLVRHVDDVLLAARAGKTSAVRLQQAMEAVERAGGQVRGIVLNNAGAADLRAV